MQRVGGVQLLRRQKHLQCARLADQPWKPLRAAPSSNEPEGRAAMAKDGVGRGDAVLTGKGQVKTAAHAVAVNGGDGGRWEGGDGLHQTLTHVRETKGFCAIQFSDLVQVGPSGEEVRVAGDEEPSGWILRELVKSCGQRHNPLPSQAIGAIGGSQAQYSGGVSQLDRVEAAIRL